MAMGKSRLLHLLRTFDAAEIREFRKFIRSPYFSRRDDLPKFFDLLVKYLKSGRQVPEKPEVFQKLFPGEKFDDHRIRMLMSFTFQLAGQYLSVKKLLEDEVQSRHQLATIFRQRNLPAHFAQAWGGLSAKHEEQPYRDADFFEEKYRISLERYQTDSARREVDGEFLKALSGQLDLAFLARKLWQACFLLSHRAVSNVEYDPGLLDEALAFAERKKLLDIPAISIYYHCYRALTEPEQLHFFQKFKAQIFEHGELFPVDELRDLHVLAINFCIRRYNAGNSTYLRDQFELYRNGFRHGYFLTDGSLSRITYQNAVTSGLVMSEFDWVEKFIFGYREKLREPYQESVFSFNLARLEYERKNCDAALQLLQKSEYGDLLLNLAARSLQMKIYYELNEFDLLDAHLKAFQTFLRRKKDLGYHRENYGNTIRLTRKLLEINPFDKEERAALRSEIEAVKGVGEKEWLLGRLA